MIKNNGNNKKKINNIKINKNLESDFICLAENKIKSLQDVIKNTIISVQKYKILNILNASDLNIAVQRLEQVFNRLEKLESNFNNSKETKENILNELQNINNEISSILKSYGTYSFDNLIQICFGNDFLKSLITNNNKDKYDIIRKYIHPIGYKVIIWDGKKKKNKDSNK